MSFEPQIGGTFSIEGVVYSIDINARPNAAPGAMALPHRVEGQQSTVYALAAAAWDVGEAEKRKALKVFKPRYRVPTMVHLAVGLSQFAVLPGLKVCTRKALNPRRHGDLLRQNFDLTYAVLMPWVDGPTWAQAIAQKHVLTPEQSRYLAHALARILEGMEGRSAAHCRLSGPNLLLPVMAQARTGAEARGLSTESPIQRWWQF